MAMKPIDVLDEESRARFQDRIKEKLAGEAIDESAEYRIRRKDGEIVWAIVNVSTFTNTDEQNPRVAVTAYDITERKLAQLELERTLAELRSANQELEIFNSAMIGRELRMIELKKEVNRLCANSGETPPYEVETDEVRP